jgi:hypothetical protein
MPVSADLMSAMKFESEYPPITRLDGQDLQIAVHAIFTEKVTQLLFLNLLVFPSLQLLKARAASSRYAIRLAPEETVRTSLFLGNQRPKREDNKSWTEELKCAIRLPALFLALTTRFACAQMTNAVNHVNQRNALLLLDHQSVL